ncbi:hypothetical protein KV100_12315 [Mumia sp. zg.B21]|uniref:hypothetical protein n=1 Tax=Mumia sp. zg.B21 TaxID=2855447 RepID=UPI001C6E0A4C|nr:hypothetical protein [Mumia sp. zg.B21]MBW9210439.1 hypothetical protein [Mumia sp. zg.B21]
MTASLEPSASYLVRRAGLVDVTHAARLLEVSAPALDIDGDGTVDGPPDPQVAAVVTRLALSHLVLQQGKLWVAERDGVLQAATVWMPRHEVRLGAVGLSEGLRETVRLELDAATVHAALDPGEDVREALGAAETTVADMLSRVAPDVVLTTLAVVPDLGPHERADILQACITAALEETDGVAAAMTLLTEHVAVLEASGFVRVAEVTVGAGHRLWVGTSR